MFQSKGEEIPAEKRRRSFIPILNLMSPRTGSTSGVSGTSTPKGDPKNLNKITLTEALQRDKIPVGSEILIHTEEELNLFNTLNIFRPKHKSPEKKQDKRLGVEETFQRRVSVRHIEKKQKVNTPEPSVKPDQKPKAKIEPKEYGETIFVQDETDFLVETPGDARKESFVQSFDFDDDLEDLLDDQKNIPNNNFSDLTFSVPKPNLKDSKIYSSTVQLSDQSNHSPLKNAGSEKYIQSQLKQIELHDESVRKMTNDVFSKFQQELEQQFSTLKEEREQEFRRITTQFQYMNDFLSRAEINIEKGEEFELFKQKSEREKKQLSEDAKESKNENLKLKKELHELTHLDKKKDETIKSLQEKIEFLLKENETQNQNLMSKESEIEMLKTQKKEMAQSFKKIIHQETVKESSEKPKEDDMNPLVKSIIERSTKNDPTLKEIVLQNSKLTDFDVSKITNSLMNNTHVRLLDLTSNLVKGSCFEDVEKLLLNTKVLEELILDECPIENSNVKKLILALEKNTSLTQCTAGKNETDEDIEKIEEYMDRNYDNKNKLLCSPIQPVPPTGPEDHDLNMLTLSSWLPNSGTRKEVLPPDSSASIFLGNPGQQNEISYYLKPEKADIIDSNSATCNIQIPSVFQNNIDESSIGLWVNSSTSFGEHSFYLSNKNMSFLVVREPLITNVPLVIQKNKTVPFSFNMSIIFMLNNYNVSVFAKNKFGLIDLNCDEISNCNVEIEQVSPFPFVLNPIEITTLVAISTFPMFNKDFRKIIARHIDSGLFGDVLICEFESNFKEEEFRMSVYVNSTIIGNSKISKDLTLEFISLKISPSFLEKLEIRYIKLIKNDSSVFIVRPHYQNSFDYVVKDLSTSQSYICLLKSNETICQVDVSSISYEYDIYLSFFSFEKTGADTFKVMNISNPLLNYKSSCIDISPHATLFGKNITLTMTFNENTLRIHPKIDDIEYYCNIKENGNVKYFSVRINENQLICAILFLGFKQTTITGFIRIPSISNQYIMISNNSSTFYYIQQGILNVDNTSNRFFLTGSPTDFMDFYVSTLFHSSLFANIKLTLNTSKSFTSEQNPSISDGSLKFNGRFFFTVPGKVIAFFQYTEGNDSFSISTNTIQFVLATASIFTSFNPIVTLSNTILTIEMKSNFLANDYGNSTFVTKFGFEKAPYHNQTKSTTSISDGNMLNFKTSMTVLQRSTYFVSISMIAFGRKLQIVSPVPQVH
eukprot:gene6200-10206_t